MIGIGDDGALLDTGDRPLAHDRATARFTGSDDARVVACHVFGTAFIRLSARSVTPRWATLGLTLEAGDSDWIESFADSVSALCEACAAELIGGDTTRGPGRATVFALGTGIALPRRDSPRGRAEEVTLRLPLGAAKAPERAIADLVATAVDLAGRGTEIRCGDASAADLDLRTLELAARTDAAGVKALRAVAGRWRLITESSEADG